MGKEGDEREKAGGGEEGGRAGIWFAERGVLDKGAGCMLISFLSSLLAD